MSDLRKLISRRIVKLREEHHMTQEQLSEILNISIKHCSSVERGVAMLSLEKLVACAQHFNVSLDYLLIGTERLYIPNEILEVYKTDNKQEREMLEKYLQMYVEIRDQMHQD